jgi:transcription factor SPN1
LRQISAPSPIGKTLFKRGPDPHLNHEHHGKCPISLSLLTLTPALQPIDLVREVFGGSESELSSDEDGLSRLHSPSTCLSLTDAPADVQQALQPREPRVIQPRPRDDAYESSAQDSEDEYDHGGSQKKRLTKPTRSRKTTDDGNRRPVQRKRKRKQPVEVDLSQLPPEQGASQSLSILSILTRDTASKMRLDMQIEAILKTKKRSSGKKKANEEVLDSFADDEVARLREAMNAAADEDIRANQEKLPATAKLRLLPEALDTLRKSVLLH